MRIVVPTNDRNGLDAKVSDHFGRCRTFTVLDESGKVIDIIENTSEHWCGVGKPPELLKKHNANVLLCRGLGPRALAKCKEFGMEVHLLEVETVKQAFEQWRKGKSKKASPEDACKDHHHHDDEECSGHHHDEGHVHFKTHK